MLPLSGSLMLLVRNLSVLVLYRAVTNAGKNPIFNRIKEAAVRVSLHTAGMSITNTLEPWPKE